MGLFDGLPVPPDKAVSITSRSFKFFLWDSCSYLLACDKIGHACVVCLTMSLLFFIF